MKKAPVQTKKTSRTRVHLIICLLLAALLTLGATIYLNTGTRPAQKQLNRGANYLAIKDYTAAQTAYTKAIALGPKIEQAYIGLSEVYRSTEQLDKAAQTLHEGLRQIPGASAIKETLEELQLARGDMLMTAGKYDDAAATYEDILSFLPGNDSAYAGMTNAYLLKGDLDKAKAIQWLGDGVVQDAAAVDQKITEADRKYAQKLLAEGRAALSGKDYVRAVGFFKNCIDLQNDALEAFIGLADAYVGLDDLDSALSCLEWGLGKVQTRDKSAVNHKIAEVNGKRAERYIVHGNAAFAAKNYSAAVTAFENAVNCKPDMVDAYVNLAEACLALNDSDTAITKLSTALTLRGNQPSLYEKLAQVYMSRGEYRAASELLQHGITATGDSELKATLAEVKKQQESRNLSIAWRELNSKLDKQTTSPRATH